MDLSLKTRTEGRSAVVIEVCGDVDACSAPIVRAEVLRLDSAGLHRVVLDLTHVDLLDSSALGVLVGVMKRLRSADGSLQLVCTEERISTLFRITKLNEVFTLHSSIDEAVAAADR